MTPKKRVIDPNKLKFVARNLNVVDINVARIEDRLRRTGKAIDLSGGSVCIIDIECCIIDCKGGIQSPDDPVINPELPAQVKGFVFKIPAQMADQNAPVYFFQEMDIKTAWTLSHKAIKVPGRYIEGRVVGLASEMFTRSALTKHGIAPTAPVIGLIPKKQ